MPSRFTGKERDSESGNDYFGARYYGSNMGRFLSPDQAAGDADPIPYADITNPQSLNLYSYVLNSPVTNSDPDGHDCVVQSRIDDNHESVSVSSGTCAGVKTGSGQSATYVPGTVTGISANGGNSIDIGYNSYDGQSSGVENAKGAPAFDHPGIDGPANAAIFGQIGNGGMAAIKAFVVQSSIGALTEGVGQGIGMGLEALQAARAAKAAEAASQAWKFGAGKSATKWANQLLKRGWTEKEISEAIASGERVPAVNNINPANGATRYISPSSGKSVVVDNVTQEVIHVGGAGFKY
jgi:RHS repeat-associated protein